MKKVSGMSFGVRFYRRAAPKSAAKEAQQEANCEETLKNIPDQVPQTTAAKPASVFRPAKIAKERMLREAAMTGDCYIIRNLVMDGVDLDTRDASGRTALNIATQYNQKEAIKTLLAAREMRRMAKLGELPETSFYGRFKEKTADY
ncbi:MAG TPA: ankyrin repeat domain-containing protein [Micavibrio sp.]|nr:ankyrin repeat domain-containing protein [Micavibrio sp.]